MRTGVNRRAGVAAALLILILLVVYSKDMIRGTDNKAYEYFQNNIWEEEEIRVNRILNLDMSSNHSSVDKISNIDAKNIFFQTLAMPLQSVCRILKRIGGHWFVGKHQQVDGDKFVCLDSLLEGDQCLVYSFGLSSDWTFEDQMDKLGCSIFAHDHTITAPPRRGRNIKYFKTGLGIGPNLKTLKQIIQGNGHQDTFIDYLKIDIEAYEFTEGGFVDWITSGALENVGQIALELHVNYDKSDNRQFIELLNILQDLYKLRFRVISHEVNMVVGPRSDDGFYTLIEVVFMKK